IEPEIELVTRIVDELGIVSVWAQASAHEHQFLRQLRELRIDGNRLRKVGHGPAFVNRDLVRVFVNHANQEMRGIFAGRVGCGLTFRQRRDNKWLVPPAVIPSTGVSNFPEALLPQLSFVAAADQRKSSTGNDGNIGAPENL